MTAPRLLWSEFWRYDAEPTSILRYQPSEAEVFSWLLERQRQLATGDRCSLCLAADTDWNDVRIAMQEAWLPEIFKVLKQARAEDVLVISSDGQRLLCLVATEGGVLAFNESISQVVKRIEQKKKVANICSAPFPDNASDKLQLISFCGHNRKVKDYLNPPAKLWDYSQHSKLHVLSSKDVFAPEQEMDQWLNFVYQQFEAVKAQAEPQWVLSKHAAIDDSFLLAFYAFGTLPWADVIVPKGARERQRWLPLLWRSSHPRGLAFLTRMESKVLRIRQNDKRYEAHILDIEADFSS